MNNEGRHSGARTGGLRHRKLNFELVRERESYGKGASLVGLSSYTVNRKINGNWASIIEAIMVEITKTVLTILVTLVALFVAAFIFRNIVVPAFVYIYHYFLHGRERAENEALSAMGENKGSYALKGMRFIAKRSVVGIQQAISANMNHQIN